MPFLGSWCTQCGPHVSVDEDGCCNACGCSAVGQGADEAHATIADLKDRLRVLGDCVCRDCGCAAVEAGSTLGTSSALCEDCDDVRYGPTMHEWERYDDHDRDSLASACVSVGCRALAGRKLLKGVD